MHDRIGAVADEVELSIGDALPVEFSEIAQHAAADANAGKGGVGSCIDLIQGRAIRPFAAGRRRLPVDGRRDHDRIRPEFRQPHLAGDLGRLA